MRARLTLLFLAAVQVTFLSAVATYWGLQSWRLVMDELALVYAQHRRLDVVLDRLPEPGSSVPADEEAAEALAGLQADAQTVDESERIADLAAALESREAYATRRSVDRLAEYYQKEQRRLRERGNVLAQVSNALLAGITGLVIASFLAFLWAIRTWFVEPVRALERATDVMSTGDLSHRIALEGDDELARLAGSINRMAASLAQIQSELVVRERFALLGELAAYTAHNIRNPLSSIRATAQGEALDLPVDDPRREPLEDIVNASDRLATWVDDLLRSVSPIGLDRRHRSMGNLVRRCAEIAGPRLRSAGIELELSVGPSCEALLDEAKLEQVVSAVLGNAIDSSPPGSRISVTVAPEGRVVTLRVVDQGPGIPVERRAQVFTPFSSNKASGTGLGLWVSQKIVVAHGGSIMISDGPGERGTAVEIRLPAE